MLGGGASGLQERCTSLAMLSVWPLSLAQTADLVAARAGLAMELGEGALTREYGVEGEVTKEHAVESP